MLNQFKCSTLLATLVFFGGSNFLANEPVILEATASESTEALVNCQLPLVEVKPATEISAEEVTPSTRVEEPNLIPEIQAFAKDLAELVKKHNLSKEHMKIVTIGFAQELAKKLNLKAEDVMALASKVIDLNNKFKNFGTIVTALSLEIEGAEKTMELFYGFNPFKELQEANTEKSVLKTLKLFRKMCSTGIKSITELVVPLKLFLPLIKDLPAELQEEIAHLVMLKQLPGLKTCLSFKICQSLGIDPEEVTKYIFEFIRILESGTTEEKTAALNQAGYLLIMAYTYSDETGISRSTIDKLYGIFNVLKEKVAPNVNFRKMIEESNKKSAIKLATASVDTVFNGPDYSGIISSMTSIIE